MTGLPSLIYIYIKDKVLSSPVFDTETLKARIADDLATMIIKMFQNTGQEMKYR